jgi:ribonuclease P protein component
MIPRKFRLIGKKNIESVKTGGKMVSSLNFSVLWLKNEANDKNSKFGLIVSKKISAKAVKRNQIKRRLRFVLMQLAPKIKRGYDLLFLTKKGISDTDTASLRNEVELILKKEGIMI